MDCQTRTPIQEPGEVVFLESPGPHWNYPGWLLFRRTGPCGENGGLPGGVYIGQIYC